MYIHTWICLHLKFKINVSNNIIKYNVGVYVKNFNL